ncbi:hypothetical protein ACFLUS_03860, partial [Chloroflexota bacterium]
MVKEKIEKEIDRIWARVQKDLNFRVPQDVKREIDKENRHLISIVDLETGLEDYEACIKPYIEGAKLQAMSYYLPIPKKTGKQPQKHYQ